MEELKELWPGGLKYAGDAVGTDSLSLAAFAGTVRAGRGCDLGCGSGLLMLLLAWNDPVLSMDGVELRLGAAEQCRGNITANGLEGRCRVSCGDLRGELLPAGSMDLVVSNPPYFAAGTGGVSPDGDRALMRTETATLAELCAAAARLLRPGGDFCLVHRTERLPEVLCALRAEKLEPKELRFLSASAERAPTLFLCRARRGAMPGLTMHPPLYQDSAEYRQICHMEEVK